MVLFAMLLFGLMAMAALVIDIGFARLAQRQMQTAVDSASLEGMRGAGDVLEYDVRQDNSERMVQWHFDDDLDPSTGDDGAFDSGGQFGAGPLVQFSGIAGDPELVASQTMSVDLVATAYKPVLFRQPETDGEFDVELARGATDTSDANLHSRSPAIPYLLARGSLIMRELIAKGIVVRATGAANAPPAVRVGLPIGDIPGAIRLAYELADWQSDRMAPKEIPAPATQIGEAISTSDSISVPVTGYCAIYQSISSSNLVVGFGWIGTEIPNDPSGVVALHNATSRLSEAWSTLSRLSEADRQYVISANRNLSHALRAPLARRIE